MIILSMKKQERCAMACLWCSLLVILLLGTAGGELPSTVEVCRYLLCIVGVLAQIRVEAKEGGAADMIKKVYVYLVLFATLMMTIGGGVAAFIAIADVLTPAPLYYQTFEDFARGMERPYIERPHNGESLRETRFTEEELREKYDTMLLEQREGQIAKAKNSLVKSLGWIVIPFPVFIYFQRRLAGNGPGGQETDSTGSF